MYRQLFCDDDEGEKCRSETSDGGGDGGANEINRKSFRGPLLSNKQTHINTHF